MIKNYFKIAWRNILRNKVTSGINILGLAIGITSFMLILLYVQDELKFDKFLNDSDRIYQVALNTGMGEQEIYIGKTPASVSHALMRNFPEIENSARVYKPGEIMMRSGTDDKSANIFSESSVLAVDSNFLDIFSFDMLAGNRKLCLREPNSIVVTKSIAKKYFGEVDPIGKILFADKDKKPLVVTGVLEDLPSQSTLQFDFLTNVAAFPVVQKMSWSWVWLQVCTYVKLKAGFSNTQSEIQKLEAKFPAMVKTEGASAFRRIGKPYEELIKNGGKWNLHLQPFYDIHLYSAGIGQVLSNISDIKYVYVFSIISLFIIILACVNFMNLSTARSAMRAKEVGIRKVLGSESRQLVKQFLIEAFLFSLIAAFFAIVLTVLFMGPFNLVTGKDLDAGLLFSSINLVYLLALTIIVGLLAGLYPAFYLSSFKPAIILKGAKNTGTGFKDFFVRNSLVVFQFSVSTALIICTLVVFKQMEFMQTKDLGLNKENILIIKNSNLLYEKQESFKNEISSMQGIRKASITTGVPTRENYGDGYIPEISTAGEQLVEDIGLSSFIVDENYIPALDIKILDGRNFSKDFSDSTSVILNEEAVKQIGWKKPIGSYMNYPGNNNQRFKVIGVAKDFNINSLHTAVTPFALFYSASKSYDLGKSYILVKTERGDPAPVLKSLEEKWKTFSPATPFDIMFLDDEFDALYKTEKRTGNVFFIFAGLSIFVACLGLLGLAIYSAGRRQKEISIRKVLGAPVYALVALLSKDFLKLVLLATIIAFPIAWWCMNKWLGDFAYKIQIEWWIFALAALVSLSLTLLTVGWQTIKAAITNPVKSLRTE